MVDSVLVFYRRIRRWKRTAFQSIYKHMSFCVVNYPYNVYRHRCDEIGFGALA